MWELDTGVPFKMGEDDSGLWEKINTAQETAVGRPCDSAGTGWGYRDMQWVFESEAEAMAAWERVRKAIKEELGFDKVEPETDDDMPTGDHPYATFYEMDEIELDPEDATQLPK